MWLACHRSLTESNLCQLLFCFTILLKLAWPFKSSSTGPVFPVASNVTIHCTDSCKKQRNTGAQANTYIKYIDIYTAQQLETTAHVGAFWMFSQSQRLFAVSRQILIEINKVESCTTRGIYVTTATGLFFDGTWAQSLLNNVNTGLRKCLLNILLTVNLYI